MKIFATRAEAEKEATRINRGNQPLVRVTRWMSCWAVQRCPGVRISKALTQELAWRAPPDAPTL